MSQITAKVVADSVSPDGKRITTMQLAYPRFVHSEFMTHRVFSRNASSSRAIPVAKMIEQVRTNPAMPVHWGKNQPGMQAREELTGYDKACVVEAWRNAAERAATHAERMLSYGAHKQIANRLLEPFQIIHVIVTATEWDNFFDQRCWHLDPGLSADPTMNALATAIWEARQASTPQLLQPGQWHLPYVDAQIEDDGKQSYRHNMGIVIGGMHGIHFMTLKEAIKASVARCARVSYLNHDGTTPDLAKDIDLHDKLVAGVPMHASPAEHQATPDEFIDKFACWRFGHQMHGNFAGWCQYRKVLEHPSVRPALFKETA